MLSDHQTLQAKAIGGGSVEFEVNWSDKKSIARCEMIRVRIGEAEAEIKRDDLVNILLHIGTIGDQKKLMPAQLTKVRKLERMLYFEFPASRDYRKDEKIQVRAPWIDTGVDVEEVLAGNIKKKSLNPFKKFIT